MGIYAQIKAYEALTPSQVVEQLKKDWEDPLFRKVAFATFGDSKYYLTAEGLKKYLEKISSMGCVEVQPLTLEDPVWAILESMSCGDLSGNAAKIALADRFETLAYGDGEVILKILDKTWRVGVTQDTINLAIPGTFQPVKLMLANHYKDRLAHDLKQLAKGKPATIQTPLVATLKYDGYRAAFHQGRSQALSRAGNAFPLRPELRTMLHDLGTYLQREYQLPEPPAIDGELFAGSWRETAMARKEGIGYSHMIVFGFMPDKNIFGGSSEPYSVPEFFEKVQKFADATSSQGASVEPPEWWYVSNEKEVQDTFQTQALQRGFEGLILRPEKHGYEGKRSNLWLKVKNEETEDLPIVGTTPADSMGKHAGLIGSVEVIRGGVVSGCHGMSDALRKQLTEMGNAILTLVAEVSYQELTPDGKLRHGVIKKIRFDKPAAEG